MLTDPSRTPVERRWVVLAGLGVLSGCAAHRDDQSGRSTHPEPATSEASRSATPSASMTSTASGTESPTPTASPTPTSSASPESPSPPPAASPGEPPWAPATRPTREAVAARYAGQAPKEWGLAVSGVTTRLPGSTGVALTLDACGGPGGGTGYDERLIALLRARQVPATVFLNQRWIAANPGPAAELVADPLFEVENHGTRHLPLSVTGRAAYGVKGTASPAEVYDEVAGADAWFRSALGRPACFFRSGTAHYDEVATAICAEVGQIVAGFSINADAGATAPPGRVAQELRRARPGDIVIAHMNRPGRGTAEGVARALPGLLDAGVAFVRMRDAF